MYFSASGNGKGQVDAAAGYLKTAARKAVVRDVHILTLILPATCMTGPVQAFKVPLSEIMLLCIKDNFFYFAKAHSSRILLNFTTIKGTQKLHCVTSANRAGKVLTRFLSCGCINCVTLNYKECLNPDYVDGLKKLCFLLHVVMRNMRVKVTPKCPSLHYVI